MPGTAEIVWGALKEVGKAIVYVVAAIAFGMFALLAQLWRELTRHTGRLVVAIVGGFLFIWGPYCVTHPHQDVYLPVEGQTERQSYDLGARIAFFDPFKPGEPVARQFMGQDRGDFGVSDPVLLAYLRDYQAYYLRFWWGYAAWLGAYGIFLITCFFREKSEADDRLSSSARGDGGGYYPTLTSYPPVALEAGAGRAPKMASAPPVAVSPVRAPLAASVPVHVPTPAAEPSKPPARRRRRRLSAGATEGDGAEFLVRLASGEGIYETVEALDGSVETPAPSQAEEGEDPLESGGGLSFKSGGFDTVANEAPAAEPAMGHAPEGESAKPIEGPVLTQAEIERIAWENYQKELIMPPFAPPAFGRERDRDYDMGM